MRLYHSKHWKRKRLKRKITDDLIEYAIQNSKVFKDKYWEGALNAICRMPQAGRQLKVIYKKTGKESIKIITAFWID